MPRRLRGQGRARVKLLNFGLHKSNIDSAPLLGRRHRFWAIALLAGITLVLPFLVVRWLVGDPPTLLRQKAEAAAHAGNWDLALGYWKAVNTTNVVGGTSYLGEARAYLALGQAAKAESALRRAINTEPSDPDAWQLLLQILFIEDRTLEAQRRGWQAYTSIRPAARTALLRTLTLGLLTDLPNVQIRTMLERWVHADPDDLNAQISLWQRTALQPRAGDLDRPTIVAALEDLLAKHPGHVAIREVLVTALADAGEPDRGRALLATWPKSQEDARYWRLRGRWDLEYNHQPQQAITALQTALADLPQDWRSWYRLARALHTVGQDNESKKATEAVTRIREILDPLILEPRLHAAFEHLDNPSALRELAGLCSQAGLQRLAEAWLAEAENQRRR